MRSIIKALLLSLLLIASFTAVAAEPSQFSLIVEEQNLPLGGNKSDRAGTTLDNVPYNELPEALRTCFDGLGELRIHLFGTDSAGKPNMTWDDLENLSFTGPYYLYGLVKAPTSNDPTEFRQSLSDDAILRYLIRLDGRPASVFELTYSSDLGTYKFYSLNEYPGGENLVNDLDGVSISERYTDDVLFIKIRAETFIVSAEDLVFNALWMEKPSTFTDLVDAAYEAQQEVEKQILENNGVDESLGGPSLMDYLNNHPAAVPATGDHLTMWIIIGVSAAAALVCLALLIARKRKRI